MSQQPPKLPDQPGADSSAEDERFVLAPEPARKPRRWLGQAADVDKQETVASNYEPQQFDLSSLPDAGDAVTVDVSVEGAVSEPHAADAASPPLGFVGEPRPARERPVKKSVQSASADDTPPLGFVSEPRPVRLDKAAEQRAPAPRLGFISRDEIAENQRSSPQASISAPKDDLAEFDVPEATAPLGYVSEPVVIARNPRVQTTAAMPSIFNLDKPEAELPPMDVPFDREAMVPQEVNDQVADEASQPSASEPDIKAFEASPQLSAVLEDVEALLPQTAPSQDQGDEQSEAAVSDDLAADATAGMLLRQARLAQGLSTEDIVQQTHMSLETVLALEEDRDPPQSAWVYVRGFYIRYAKTLGMDPELLLAAHQQSSGKTKSQPDALSSEWAPQDVSPQDNKSQHLLIVVISVLLGVLAWWLAPKVTDYVSSPQTAAAAKELSDRVQATTAALKDKGVGLKNRGVDLKNKGMDLFEQAAGKVVSGTEVLKKEGQRIRDGLPVKQAKPAEIAAVVAAPAVTEPIAEAPVEMSEDIPADEAPAEPNPTMQPTAQEAVEAQEPQVVNPAMAGVLALSFSRQSWVSVTDANGLLLFEGMVEGDEQRRFEGEAPLTLFLGTATAATATYAGQVVDIASQMRSNGTARIQLGEASPE